MNTSLSDVDKFNYLRSLLQGPALDAVSGLTLTAANYKEAVSILEKRFGNKQQIVAKHMETLLSIDPVMSTYNLKALRQLYDTVESQVRGLKSLGVSSDSYGSLLSSVLLTKLPQELRLIISRKVDDDDRKLDKLMELLEEEVRARERGAASSTMSPKKSAKGPSTAAALLTGGPDAGPTCCYCQQPHPSHSCRAVESIEERKHILRGAGRCFVCLKRGHIGRHCRSNVRCIHCHGRHHGSLCQRKSPQTTTMPRTSKSGEAHLPPTVSQSRMNPAAPVFQPPTSTALWANTNQAVLLQTAQVLVFNPDDPHRSKRVRIVLDSGSQRSYIMEQLKTELALTSSGEQSMSIMTFGSREENPRVCEIVNVYMELRGGQTEKFALFVVPLICEPLTCQPVVFCQDNFQHLSGLTLADQSDGQERLEVDILIGSDQYWSLITGKTRGGESGPVGVETKLGWVLSGSVELPTDGQARITLVTHTLHIGCTPTQDVQVLDDHLKSFWDLESFGITGPKRSVLDERRFILQGRGTRCHFHGRTPQLAANQLSAQLAAFVGATTTTQTGPECSEGVRLHCQGSNSSGDRRDRGASKRVGQEPARSGSVCSPAV